MRRADRRIALRGGPQPGSLDNLVRAQQQRLRNRKAEGLRGLEVDDQFDLCRLQDRQIGRLSAVEDLAGVDTSRDRIFAEDRGKSERKSRDRARPATPDTPYFTRRSLAAAA